MSLFTKSEQLEEPLTATQLTMRRVADRLGMTPDAVQSLWGRFNDMPERTIAIEVYKDRIALYDEEYMRKLRKPGPSDDTQFCRGVLSGLELAASQLIAR